MEFEVLNMWLHRCTALEQIGKQFEVQKIAGFPSSSRHKFFASKNYYLMGQKVLNKKPKQKQKQEHRETGRVIEMVGDTSFGKTICSICYEDLKPLSEYLQAITPCGHVFHEHWSVSLSMNIFINAWINKWKVRIWNWWFFVFGCLV